jgi:hypothetical protein
MALKQASRLLLVLLTAWSLCGIAVLLDIDSAPHPSQALVSYAYAGDPDEFSDGTTAPDPGTSSDSDSHDGLVTAILHWFEDAVRDLF